MKNSVKAEAILELFLKCYPEESHTNMLHLETLMGKMSQDWCLRRINGEDWQVKWGLNGQFEIGSTMSLGVMKALISIKEGKR